MKKFAKLSLVAAVAVAGLSTANASSLEEAIKGVDVSGMVRYRFTETNTEEKEANQQAKVKDTQENDYDIELTAKVPVNDMVKAIVKLDVDGDLSAETDDGNAGETNPDIEVEDAYFSYTNSGFVVNAGKQSIPGPLVDGLNGTGLVAMAPLGPVTVAAAYFNGTDDFSYSYDGDTKINMNGNQTNVYAAALLASFDMINLSAWYAKADVAPVMVDSSNPNNTVTTNLFTTTDADAYSVAADGTVGPVKLGIRYSEKDIDGIKKDDLSVLKLTAAASFGMFDVSAGFAKTGDDNGKYGGAALDGSSDAVVNDFQLEQADVTSEMNDAKAWKLGLGVNPTEKVSFGLDYLNADAKDNADDDLDYEEFVVSAAYKMSENFSISSFYSIAEVDGKDFETDMNKGRLELKYSF